jgi:hypothetical protein
MKTTLPKTLVWVGVPFVAAALLLASLLVWQQTVLSWNNGIQSVGFGLAHSGIGIILAISLIVGLVWAAAILIAMAVKRSFGGPLPVALMLVFALALGAIAAPYGFWQRMFLDKYLPDHAGELFTFAAATGDMKTVKAMLERGVDIDIQGRYGTALHGAAVENKRYMMSFLIEHGANVNALNRYGDSPLGYATNSTPETREFLQKYGGQKIQGSEEKRNQIIHEDVLKEIEREKLEMDLDK